MDKLKSCPITWEQANEAAATLLSIAEDGISCQQKALNVAFKALYWIANDRRPAPENKPLTLEQLRQMDGEPVWIKAVDPNDPDTDYWAIVSANMHYSQKSGGVISTSTDRVAIVAIAYFEDYGKTWLAYARKPEQEEK